MSSATTTLVANVTRVTATATPPTTASSKQNYAAVRNKRFSNKKGLSVSIDKRWNDIIAALTATEQASIQQQLTNAIAEFRRRMPHVKSWTDLDLVDAKSLMMSTVYIDITIQRLLDPDWILKIINKFKETMVMPISVYKDEQGVYHARDGQHTLIVLWIIATKILGVNPDNVQIPVNIYKDKTRAEVRENFISSNSDGKLQLDAFDIYEQKICGVRVDGSKNPDWLQTELKQRHIETNGMFVTAKKFGDANEPGAISRLNEINKMSVDAVKNCCEYLKIVGCDNRAVEEKEMVMMGQFFDRCYHAEQKYKTNREEGDPNVVVTAAFIKDLATVTTKLWNANFEPGSKFWVKGDTAYKNWHKTTGITTKPKFMSEPVHGMPFMLACLNNHFSHAVPLNRSTSEFNPSKTDLF